MKKRKDFAAPNIGGSSLLVIFAVLCLTVLSLLSLSTVLAERRLSDAYGQATARWYAADLEAQEIYARLRSGETVEQMDGQYTYSVTVSEHQTLRVTLENRNGSWEVISWQAQAHPEDGNSTLPVWQGQEG